MSLNVWTQPTGYSLGNFPESVSISLTLPITNGTGITFSVISGALPGGLRIEGSTILGSPYIVSNDTTYKFCIRATDGTNISDRTLTITITGSNVPVFVTALGPLPIGIHQQLYVLDDTHVDYQIEAFDLNTVVGSKLTYFIASDDGVLPKGLNLSSSGRITGFIQPTYKITALDGSGTYDDGYYDAVAFDFGTTSNDGFDSYQYDDVFYDYNSPLHPPNSINANYQFRVTLTDGVNYSQRIFKIFVVGTDQFRADSTTLDGGAGGFTADATYLREPVWINDSNLGVFRANNYITLPIVLYDNKNVIFNLSPTNQEVRAITRQITNLDNTIGSYSLTITSASSSPQFGQWISFENYIPNATGDMYQIAVVADLGGGTYRLTLSTGLLMTLPEMIPFYMGSLSTLPPGTNFDVGTGEVYGIVPYQPAISKTYMFTLVANRFGDKGDTTTAYKTFTVTIIGEIDSTVKWNTDSVLETLHADYYSTLSINAVSSVPNSIVIYTITDGALPPGLTLNLDGEIIGKVNQYYNPLNEQLGLIRFDTSRTTFDGGATTFDHRYTFTVQAQDQFGYSSSTRTFTLTIDTPNTTAYSNITARPFLKSDQRSIWKGFINDPTIFTPSSIYRINDPTFGIQSNLSLLIYGGIETKEAAAYIGATGLNHKRKRFQFGNVAKSTAVDPVTGVELYEVIYVNMIDPLTPTTGTLPNKIVNKFGISSNQITVDSSTNFWNNSLNVLNLDAPNAVRPEPIITADSTGFEVSNPNPNTIFPNSIANWQSRLSGVGLTERNYLPLWMRTIQTGQKQEQGYTLAIPICFCKVGTANDILLNIKFSKFDFTALDYTIDRYTIDSVSGYLGDKYLIFRNDRITV